MLKRALLKFNCIIKQSALKTLSTRPKESRNIQGTVKNVENSYQKNFKKKSLKIFFKTQKSKTKNANQKNG